MSTIPARLETLLAALLKEHEALLDVASMIREAIRKADADALRECLSKHTLAMDRIGELERERAQLVKAAGRVARPDPTKPVRLGDLAASLDDPERSRLGAAADRLRETVAKVSREQKVLAAAMGALAGHLEGVMRGVARSLNRAQTYSSRGSVEAASIAAGGLDLKT